MGKKDKKQKGTEIADGVLYRLLMELAKPFKFQLFFLFLLDLLDSFWVVLNPVPLKMVIDSVVGSRPINPSFARFLPTYILSSPTSLLMLAVVMMIGLAFLGGVQSLASSLYRTKVGEKLLLDFRSRLFRHCQLLSLAYHDKAGTSDTLYRINKDASSIEDIIVRTFLPLVRAALTIGLMFFVVLWLDWQLALVAGLVAPVLLLLSWKAKHSVRQLSRRTRDLESASVGILYQVLSSLRVVKAFRQEDREVDRYRQNASRAISASQLQQFAQGIYALGIRLTIAIATASVLYIGVLHVQSGRLTLGELLLVLTYSGQLYDPLKTMSRKAGGIQSHLASAERAFALLEQKPTVADHPDAKPIGRVKGGFELEEVSFAYDNDLTVLNRLSLEIEPGQRVGIVGATGAGKTTLINLLLRLEDPMGGRILLDGHDLRDVRLCDLRAQFALVLQEPILFSATIAENIAYGRPVSGAEAIEAAARAAKADEFINRLPMGYQTVVGEKGMTLSGGERQRIALARAFLLDAPILLLDEPTSSVDLQTETEILSALERLIQGRTTILITHRTSPLNTCDVVYHLEGGKLLPAKQSVFMAN